MLHFDPDFDPYWWFELVQLLSRQPLRFAMEDVRLDSCGGESFLYYGEGNEHQVLPPLPSRCKMHWSQVCDDASLDDTGLLYGK
jgi:hypothetical protein